MKLLKKLTIIFAVGLSVVSCDDYLDQLPDNRTQLNSPDAIGKILINAYPKATYAGFCEVMSDNVGDKGKDAQVNTTNNTDAYKFEEFFNSTYEGTPSYYWTACYLAIAHANQALEAIEKAGDTQELASYKGEALVARAYSHFMLVNLFAKTYNAETAESDLGVPYVKEVEKVLVKHYKRNTIKEVYDFIEADLTAGIKLLDDTRYEVPKYHFNKAAANAFASRFYLWRGASKEDFKQAIEHANSVLGNNPVPLLRDFNGFYTEKSYQDKEAQYTKATEKPNLLLSESVDAWGYYYAYQRFSLNIERLQEIFGAGKVKRGISYAYGLHGNDKSAHFPKWKNYKIMEGPNSSNWTASFMMPLFTVDEVLFNRIEAEILSDDLDEVIRDFNYLLTTRVEKYDAAAHTITLEDIHAKYQMPSQSLSSLIYYLDLKRMDFIHEGMRWFDIRRFGIPVTHTTNEGDEYTLKGDDPKKVLQIPEDAIENGLTRNAR